MIRVMIVDDQPLMRDGLMSILNLKENINVIATASNGQEAFEKAQSLEPDIVLMDIRMPGVNGVEGARLITSHLSHTKVLMLTTFNDSELIFDALNEGASGYLLKDMPTDTIVQAIVTVHAGGVVLPKELTQQIFKELRKTKPIDEAGHMNGLPKIIEDLTEREIEVLELLGQGLNNREIAKTLIITEGTVKNHVSNIISKLDLRDRTQAAIFAVRYGITKFDI
ncbi:MAG: response regulator [Tuberibacillus sp.]